jgi:hypothetical protein
MSHLQKWRRWCRRIEEDILIPYKYDMLVAEEYFRIIDPIIKTGQPAVFHNWCTLNYGKCLCLVLRKLCDSDHRVYSIRKLVGGSIPDDDQNVVYTFDWQSVFSVKWLNDKEHKLYG